MIKVFIFFFIFCFVLFIYLHVQFHLKTSNDLEVYELEDGSKDKLDEICDLRQPVLFDFDNDKIIQTVNKSYILENFSAFEIKIRNSNDTDYINEIYMPLPLVSAKKLFDEDKSQSYFSENNSDFLTETGLKKNMLYNDEFIRPPMVSNCNYDVLFGSQDTCTPFRYKINYRNFFVVTEGSIKIKLSPPHSSKYLHCICDYENFEFRSPMNPWKIQPRYSADFDKIKCLEIILLPGKTINIPPYWWYSIKFEKDASVACFHYKTYMNNIAILPHIGMYVLQMQNVKREVVKKHDIKKYNQKLQETKDFCELQKKQKEQEKEEQEEQEKEEQEKEEQEKNK